MKFQVPFYHNIFMNQVFSIMKGKLLRSVSRTFTSLDKEIYQLHCLKKKDLSFTLSKENRMLASA